MIYVYVIFRLQGVLWYSTRNQNSKEFERCETVLDLVENCHWIFWYTIWNFALEMPQRNYFLLRNSMRFQSDFYISFLGFCYCFKNMHGEYHKFICFILYFVTPLSLSISIAFSIFQFSRCYCRSFCTLQRHLQNPVEHLRRRFLWK